jgi:fructose-specific component phosphotransferase system IIB-like protein
MLIGKTAQAGTQLEVDGEAPMSVVVGNARHVKLERNGKNVDLVKSTKATVSRLKLE